MVRVLFMIGAGSFIGGISRFLLSRLIQINIVSSFPFGTFIVNVLGCFLIGLIFGLSERTHLITPEWRLFLTVGFCGGFTTFSTFAYENFSLLNNGSYFYFAGYSALSLFLGMLAVYAGHLITKIL